MPLSRGCASQQAALVSSRGVPDVYLALGQHRDGDLVRPSANRTRTGCERSDAIGVRRTKPKYKIGRGVCRTRFSLVPTQRLSLALSLAHPKIIAEVDRHRVVRGAPPSLTASRVQLFLATDAASANYSCRLARAVPTSRLRSKMIINESAADAKHFYRAMAWVSCSSQSQPSRQRECFELT